MSTNIQSEESLASAPEARKGSTVLGGFLALLVGIPVWLIFVLILFFPGAGPIGKTSFVGMLLFLAPVIGLFGYVCRSAVGVAFLPFAGIVNALVIAVLTKNLSNSVAVFCNLTASALWIALPYIVLLRRRKSNDLCDAAQVRKDDA